MLWCRYIVISLLSLSVTSLDATTFPKGCEPTGFQFGHDFLVLNSDGKQTYYLIQNASHKTIQLERYETHEVFMSPKLEATFLPSNWSAFASDEKGLFFSCAEKNEETFSKVNCETVLKVCQYPRVRFALSNMGNYWVSSNKSMQMVINESVAKGIYLKW